MTFDDSFDDTTDDEADGFAFNPDNDDEVDEFDFSQQSIPEPVAALAASDRQLPLVDDVLRQHLANAVRAKAAFGDKDPKMADFCDESIQVVALVEHVFLHDPAVWAMRVIRQMDDEAAKRTQLKLLIELAVTYAASL